MEKNVVKSLKIKTSIANSLQAQLKIAVHKVLRENKSELTEKIRNIINKSIKKIAKKTDKQIKKTLKIQ